MLETRFASLNPFMQYMFLKLHEIEYPEKKAFILEALRLEFKDVIIEARKVLKCFHKLGSPIKVISTNDEGAISAVSPIQFQPFSYFNQDGNTPCRVASVLDGASNLFRSKGFCPCPVSCLFRSNYVIIHIINY
jgi:hypothetical protein